MPIDSRQTRRVSAPFGGLAVEVAQHRLERTVHAHRLAPDEAGERAVLLHEIDEALGGLLGAREEIERVPAGGHLRDRGADGFDRVEELADDREEDLALLLEVEVVRALGDAGGSCDVLDGRLVVAALAEQRACGRQELGATGHEAS
jgi:hypothetical protein